MEFVEILLFMGICLNMMEGGIFNYNYIAIHHYFSFCSSIYGKIQGSFNHM